MAYKPFMQKSFESKSIYPWRYTWNRYSMEFLEYLNQCGKVVLGKEYAMYELLEIIREIIEHKRNDHHMSNEIIALEFSFFLNVPIEEINVSDTRTFIYPILFHLLSKSFEELWMDKHKLAWRTPYDLKRSHAQILNSIKYPPCTLREQDNTSYVEVPSPVYSELSINEENNEQNTDLPAKTMRTETDPEIEPEKEKPATIEISPMDDKDKTIDVPAIDDVD
jgi:predicted small metal-binding protein